jgi:hypothetical protein
VHDRWRRRPVLGFWGGGFVTDNVEEVREGAATGGGAAARALPQPWVTGGRGRRGQRRDGAGGEAGGSRGAAGST